MLGGCFGTWRFHECTNFHAKITFELAMRKNMFLMVYLNVKANTQEKYLMGPITFRDGRNPSFMENNFRLIKKT